MSFTTLLHNSDNFAILEILLTYLSYGDIQKLLLVCKDWRDYLKNSKTLKKRIFQEKLETSVTTLIFQELGSSTDILWYCSNITGWLLSTFTLNREYIPFENIPKKLKKFYLLERSFIAYKNLYKIAIDNVTYTFCPKQFIIQIDHKKACTCCLSSLADPWHLSISYSDTDFQITPFLCPFC